MKNFLLIAAFATTTLATTAQVTSLHENFDSCDTSNVTNGAHPTGWVAYSAQGSQVWKWSVNKFGVRGTSCMAINGYSGGNNYVNKDYLITPKIDFSAYTTATFNFYKKELYSGDTLAVKYSTDYTGSGDPSSATWNVVPAINNITDTNRSGGVYTGFSCNMTTVKSTPMYFAFIYTSTTFNGRLIDVDSVFTDTVYRKLTNAFVGVQDINNSQINTPVMVLGNPTSNSMTLEFTAAEAGAFVVTVTDMSGRKVVTKSVNAVDGQNFITISDMNAVPGFYIVDVRNETSFGVTKTVIR